MGFNEKTRETICDFCGATKQGISFVIGASKEPEWCMIYGTGKMACPDCYEAASKQGEKAVDNHIKAHNARCEAARG